MKIKDLTEKLEVSERQIRRYKEDLEGKFRKDRENSIGIFHRNAYALELFVRRNCL